MHQKIGEVVGKIMSDGVSHLQQWQAEHPHATDEEYLVEMRTQQAIMRRQLEEASGEQLTEMALHEETVPLGWIEKNFYKVTRRRSIATPTQTPGPRNE